MSQQIDFNSACRLLESILAGETRREVLKELSSVQNFDDALLRLRKAMRSHSFKSCQNIESLDRTVQELDCRTRRDGFNVLHDWDGKAEVSNEEIIPVDVLNYLIGARSIDKQDRQRVLAILFDYYFLYILALVCMRAWDEGDANTNLDRATGLIQLLQGPQGSGHLFLDNAETLILIATSHFEPDVRSYAQLLEKVRTLNENHRVNMALAQAPIQASHLRHGFEALYKRDVGNMREDNPPDYPWLLFSVATLMKTYVRMHAEDFHGLQRERAVEGILNGLSPDTRAFLGKPPAALLPFESEHAEFRDLLKRFKQDLFLEFEQQRPSTVVFSPLAFTFNFPHNLLKGLVVNAIIEGKGAKLSLNDLLTGLPGNEGANEARLLFVKTLAAFARSNPDKILNKMAPVIAYDPYQGIRNFNKTINLADGS